MTVQIFTDIRGGCYTIKSNMRQEIHIFTSVSFRNNHQSIPKTDYFFIMEYKHSYKEGSLILSLRLLRKTIILTKIILVLDLNKKKSFEINHKN